MRVQIFLTLTCLAVSVHSCDLVLSELQISQVFTFSVESSSFQLGIFKLCLNISTFERSQSYVARLDYMPNVGLDANNDNSMQLQEGQLRSQIQITKRSDPLNMDKNSSYSYIFAVQIRKADSITIGTRPFLIYDYFLNQYIWILSAFAIISWFGQRHLFAIPQEKAKTN